MNTENTNFGVTEVSARELRKKKLTPSPALISGLLRKGQTLMLTAASKSGKSFMLLQMALCLSSGTKFLNFDCQQCRVLYCDIENGEEEQQARLDPQADALKSTDDDLDRLHFLFFDGLLTDFVEKVIASATKHRSDIIIIDPIYELFSGDENSSVVAQELMSSLRRIKQETGAALIFAHHHTKGYQAGRSAIDRGAGSGILARAVQAKLDMTQIYADLDSRKYGPKAKAFELSSNLRSFPEFTVPVVFDYPLFVLDTNVKRTNRSEKQHAEKAKRLESFKKEFARLQGPNNQPVVLKELAKALDRSEKTVRDYIKDNQDNLPGYTISKGLVYYE